MTAIVVSSVPQPLVAVSDKEYEPPLAYVCEGWVELPVNPSPKSQMKLFAFVDEFVVLTVSEHACVDAVKEACGPIPGRMLIESMNEQQLLVT